MAGAHGVVIICSLGAFALVQHRSEAMSTLETILFHLVVAVEIACPIADLQILGAVRVGHRRVDAFGGWVYT